MPGRPVRVKRILRPSGDQDGWPSVPGDLVNRRFRIPAALSAALQPDEDVARIRLRREEAELRTGAALDRRNLRRLEENLLDLPQLAVRLLEGATSRGLIVDDEASLIGLR